MKKHLIAAAVAGAFAVPAMAQVTVSGTLIYDLLNSQDTETTAAAATAATKVKESATGYIGARSWTASQISFAGTEDLGGGLKASFVANVDLRNEATTGWGTTRDQNLSLAGDFGTVRIGRFINASSMAYHGFSGAPTTTFGSTYSIGTGSGMIAAAPGGSFERNSNQIQYTTPSMSGLTANVSIAQNSNDATATAGKAETTLQGLSVSYSAGPLSAGVGMNSKEISAEGASATAAGAKVEADLNWVGAAYDLGVAKVSVANITREDSDIAAGTGVKTKARDVSVTSFGVSVPMGAMTLSAAMYDGDDKGSAATTDNTDMSGYQVSVRYALSKRTTVYAVMGENEIKRTNAAGASKTTSGSAIGLMHTF
ncbi:MAG: hypothetical protein RLZZ344_406 [Pseudomonadota bacterium]|jgi:predicted porin